MALIVDRRVTAKIDGDFVVFLIGMRINRPWKPHKWLPNLRAMPKMLKELDAAPPELGSLGYTNLGAFSLVQYWRSFDHLEAYARARDKSHWPAWLEFNRLMRICEAMLASGTRPISSGRGNTRTSIAGCLSWASPRLRRSPTFPLAQTPPVAVWALDAEAQLAAGANRLNSPV